MTQDIIRMAREAGAFGYVHDAGEEPFKWQFSKQELVAFAKLVAAKERDRIFKNAKQIIKRAEARGAAKERDHCCEKFEIYWNSAGLQRCYSPTEYIKAEEIRARGVQ